MKGNVQSHISRAAPPVVWEKEKRTVAVEEIKVVGLEGRLVGEAKKLSAGLESNVTRADEWQYDEYTGADQPPPSAEVWSVALLFRHVEQITSVLIRLLKWHSMSSSVRMKTGLNLRMRSALRLRKF